jgi:hypothetical protein
MPIAAAGYLATYDDPEAAPADDCQTADIATAREG